MSALYTALVESETKESLAQMVCELREKARTPDPEFCALAERLKRNLQRIAGTVAMDFHIWNEFSNDVLLAITALRSGDKGALGNLKEEMGK